MSISSSLISISWSLVSYSKSLRISLPNKIPMTYSSIAIMFLWEFFSLTARMLALALFTSAFVHYVGFVFIAHWACMTFWIITMETNFCNTRCEEFGFNVVLGVIFVFCYFNPVDNATRYRYLAFYVFMFFENSAFLLLWTKKVTYDKWIIDLVLRTHYICFSLGIILMVRNYLTFTGLQSYTKIQKTNLYSKQSLRQLIYYRWFHPTGGIRIFRSQCS